MAGQYQADSTNKIHTTEDTEGTKSFQYDPNGNIIDDGKNTYVFDVENKLLEARNKATGAVTVFKYDAEGRRPHVISSGVEKSFILNGSQVAEVRDGSGSLLQWNIWGLGVDELLRAKKAGVDYYPLTNDQDSVYALMDGSGVVLQISHW